MKDYPCAQDSKDKLNIMVRKDVIEVNIAIYSDDNYCSEHISLDRNTAQELIKALQQFVDSK